MPDQSGRARARSTRCSASSKGPIRCCACTRRTRPRAGLADGRRDPRLQRHGRADDAARRRRGPDAGRGVDAERPLAPEPAGRPDRERVRRRTRSPTSPAAPASTTRASRSRPQYPRSREAARHWQQDTPFGVVTVITSAQGVRAIGLPEDDLAALVGDSEAACDDERRTRARRRGSPGGPHRSRCRSTSTASTGSAAPCSRRSCGRSAGARRSPTASSRRWRVGPAPRARSGTAMASNPLPFVIPCHRVVAAGGRIGGYGGGRNAVALEARRCSHARASRFRDADAARARPARAARARDRRRAADEHRYPAVRAAGPRDCASTAPTSVVVESVATGPADRRVLRCQPYRHRRPPAGHRLRGVVRRVSRSTTSGLPRSARGSRAATMAGFQADGSWPPSHGERVVVCTHSDVIDAALRWARGLEPDRRVDDPERACATRRSPSSRSGDGRRAYRAVVVRRVGRSSSRTCRPSSWTDQLRVAAKKSLPLSSTTMNAGKSRTSIFHTASIPSSGYSSTSTLVMQSLASRAAGPPIEPR